MNKVFLIGNLARDPECGTTQNGTEYCRFTLAVNRRFTDANGQRQADFLTVTAWRKLAEIAGKYLAKGRKCAVVGTIQTRSWEQDGQKRYATDIIADEIEFLNTAHGTQPLPDEPPETTGTGSAETEAYTGDDELPF